MNIKSLDPTVHKRGFSLIELLLTVSAVAIIAAVAVMFIGNSRNTLKQGKLDQDVARLNSAVKVFLSNGGSLDGITTAHDALTELKKAANAKGQAEVVGIRGSMIDSRIEAVIDSGAVKKRALWKSDVKRFVIETRADGIEEFRLNEALGAVNYADAERETSLVYNATQGWVWASVDHEFGSSTGPSGLPERDAPTLGAIDGSVAGNGAQLGVPTISPDSGIHPLSHFPLEVTITKNNIDPPDSKLYYSVVSGVWTLYSEPFEVSPGTDVFAYSTNADPAWDDSDHAAASFNTDPEALEIAVYTPASPVTYVEAGGEVEPGDFTPTDPISEIMVTLPGGYEIPDVYENSDQFQFFWTIDGTDPRSSNTRVTGITFQNGYKNNNGHGNNASGVDISNPNWKKKARQNGWTEEEIAAFESDAVDDELKPHDKIAYTIGEWGPATLLPIKVVALSKNHNLVTNSYVHSTNITIQRIELRSPEIVYTDEPVRGDTVEISLEVDFGDMPTNSRVYYTTDGTDPGDDGYGNPTSGTLYTGPFDPLLGTGAHVGEAMIIARVYPPENYTGWFNVSNPSNSLFVTPAWDLDGVATGWFDNDGVASNDRYDFSTGSIFSWRDESGGTSAGFENVSNRERFQIGTLSYHNGTGYRVGDVDAFDFSVSLDLSAATTSFNYEIQQFITYNDGTDWDNADSISFVDTESLETVNLYGSDYYLNLEFGESSGNSTTTQDEFLVQEGETATAELFGTLISMGSWW